MIWVIGVMAAVICSLAIGLVCTISYARQLERIIYDARPLTPISPK
jgi:hypothetical protein